ncbi:MAG: T9SS type A sorting domain-containing protein [Saprospiraceae bacterium]
MKIIFTNLLAFLLTTSAVFAQNDVDFNAADNWIGYMNVFQLPADGGGYEFGSPWEVPSLKTIINVAENTLSLQPNFNTYGENSADAYWVNQTTMEGNKNMEAVTFVEPGATFNGQDLTFSGTVMLNDLNEAYTANFFIKALDPNNDYQDALAGSKVEALPASGAFTISATAAELASGLVIQYGFSVIGQNANPADEATLGSVRIGNMTTSTENIEKEITSVSISPNPVNESFKITTESSIQSYEVRNLAGQSLLKGTDTEVDVATLSSGIYLVVVDLEDRIEVVKFVKN